MSELKLEEVFHRPEQLEAEIVRFQNEYEKWVAIVGLYNHRPIEIFAGQAEDFWIPQYVEKGLILKIRPDGVSSRYDFQFKDRGGYTITIEALSRSFNREFWNYAKMISWILRYGMPLPFVVNILTKFHFETDSLNTWKNGVGRALKQFIPDGTIDPKLDCPKCKEVGMVYMASCLVCKKCGYTSP